MMVGCTQTTTTVKQTTKADNTTEKQEDSTTKKEGSTTQSQGADLGFLNEACKGAEVYLTTCGQADTETIRNVIYNMVDPDEEFVNIIEVGATKAEGKVNIQEDNNLNTTQVSLGGDKTPVVLLVLGTSVKGLGAAGTDVDKESQRATEFANLAKEGKIILVCMHVGGTARRGEMSDPVIRAALPGATMVVVTADGNTDSLFTTLSTENNVAKFFELSKLRELAPYLKALFGIN